MSNTNSANAEGMSEGISVPQAIDMLHRAQGLIEIMFLAGERLDDRHMAHAFTTTCHQIDGIVEEAKAALYATLKGGAK